MYKSNLSFKQLDLYLNALMQSGLVEEHLDDEVGRVYSVTPRGLSFLELFEVLTELFTVTKIKKEERMRSSIREESFQPVPEQTSKAFVY